MSDRLVFFDKQIATFSGKSKPPRHDQPGGPNNLVLVALGRVTNDAQKVRVGVAEQRGRLVLWGGIIWQLFNAQILHLIEMIGNVFEPCKPDVALGQYGLQPLLHQPPTRQPSG